jgi:hypothetical protein
MTSSARKTVAFDRGQTESPETLSGAMLWAMQWVACTLGHRTLPDTNPWPKYSYATAVAACPTYVGRLYDLLAAHFGVERVFADGREFSPGSEYTDLIERSVGSSQVVLVIIGKAWLTADSTGRRPLDDPADVVRRETATALARGIRLADEIRARDLFLLFWTAAAANSEWVTWEWKTALAAKGKDRLQVHALESGIAPPEQLEDLHFGDVMMLIRDAGAHSAERQE